MGKVVRLPGGRNWHRILRTAQLAQEWTVTSCGIEMPTLHWNHGEAEPNCKRCATASRKREAEAERRRIEHEQAVAMCKHQPEHVEQFTWEHDDGYGRQSQVRGQRCSFCGARQAWAGMSGWYRPRKDDDR